MTYWKDSEEMRTGVDDGHSGRPLTVICVEVRDKRYQRIWDNQ
jgi:hypothetical protein